MRGDAQRNGVSFRPSVFQFRPYHGTELFHQLEQAGTELADKDARFDAELSARIGRPQYNFEAGNFSMVPDGELRSYLATLANIRA